MQQLGGFAPALFLHQQAGRDGASNTDPALVRVDGGSPMPHQYTLEVFRNGEWVAVKGGLSATLAAFGSALAMLKNPGELWRAVRDDGEVFLA